MWEGVLTYIPPKATMSGEKRNSQKRDEIEPLEKKKNEERMVGRTIWKTKMCLALC